MVGSIKIAVEIEPIVKVYCANIQCWHNLIRLAKSELAETEGPYYHYPCNLKYIKLDEAGKCTDFEPRT